MEDDAVFRQTFSIKKNVIGNPPRFYTSLLYILIYLFVTVKNPSKYYKPIIIFFFYIIHVLLPKTIRKYNPREINNTCADLRGVGGGWVG